MRDIATFIALNRFGLGASPGEAERVYVDPRGWILSQINPKSFRFDWFFCLRLGVFC